MVALSAAKSAVSRVVRSADLKAGPWALRMAEEKAVLWAEKTADLLASRKVALWAVPRAAKTAVPKVLQSADLSAVRWEARTAGPKGGP